LAITFDNEAEESALAVKPTPAPHEGARVGAVAEQTSAPTALNVDDVVGLHSAGAGAVQVTVGGAALTTMVSLHVAALPALSVAVHTMTCPLLL
jgi:hypothetical protein